EQIRNGQLKPGDELPSVRELAQSLNINLHTVRHAYQKLREQNIVTIRFGQRAKIKRQPEQQPDENQIKSVLIYPLRELITEAYLMGLSSKCCTCNNGKSFSCTISGSL
ncbi:MAG: GntR family transcriptional regulator, partial [Chloroflexi bacterium]|nr:GntR family transcriptional regulator [Chloroflexota bacterium]